MSIPNQSKEIHLAIPYKPSEELQAARVRLVQSGLELGASLVVCALMIFVAIWVRKLETEVKQLRKEKGK
jgi:hypothetical protein